jgi:hypothetical protein
MIDTSQLTTAQRDGKACIDCDATELPLHPAGTVEVRVAVGVVQDVETARCTNCLVAAR